MKIGFFSNMRVRRMIYRAVLFVTDSLCTAAAFLLAFWTRFYWPPFEYVFPITKGVPSFAIYQPLFITAVAAGLISYMLRGFYGRVNIYSFDEFLRVTQGVLLAWIVVAAGTAFYRAADYSRLVLLLSAVYAVGFLFLSREIMKWFYHRLAGRWEPHTVMILGNGRMARSIEMVLGWHREISIIRKTARDPEQLRAFLQTHEIREVFVGEPDVDHATLVAMSDVCEEFGVPFRIVPDVLELRMGEVVIDTSLGLPTFSVKPVSLHGWTYFYKRLFDVSASITILSLAFFPLILIAILVRLDSRGPVLFRQLRMGHRNKAFPFFKFRTMVANADDYLEKLKAQSERSGPVFKMKNDPRVTRVGKFLRKFSLDELPQIFNVLMGHMSLVGPRPQVLWEASAYDEWARKRLNVLPGITGLWQVSGRAQLSYEQMIELDVYYIEHWSPGLDLKILLRTVPTILGGQGAY